MTRFSLLTDMRPAPGTRPTPEHFDRVLETVAIAERLGFHTVWTTEQHGLDDGYLPTHLPVLSAIARETTRIRLGAGVILLPLAQPRRIVEEACVVDMLSAGRLTIGVGAGHHPHEFAVFGRRPADRARLMEEGLAILRAGLAGEVLPDGHPVNVPPVQAPIPLIVGAAAPRAVDRAVRLGDGHMAYAYEEPEAVLARLWREQIAPAMERHGRAVGGFALIFTSVIWASPDWEREWERFVGPAFAYQQRRYREWAAGAGAPEGVARVEDPRGMLVGPPGEIAERLSALRAIYPFDEVVIWPQLPGVPDELAREQLHIVATEVAPAVR